MKQRKIWAIFSAIIGAGLIVATDSMQIFTLLKYFIASIGGGFIGLAVMLIRSPAKVKRP
ncbi:MAG: hypothetical protein WCG75_06330 [Armatimonadota bacterium]